MNHDGRSERERSERRDLEVVEEHVRVCLRPQSHVPDRRAVERLVEAGHVVKSHGDVLAPKLEGVPRTCGGGDAADRVEDGPLALDDPEEEDGPLVRESQARTSSRSSIMVGRMKAREPPWAACSGAWVCGASLASAWEGRPAKKRRGR